MNISESAYKFESILAGMEPNSDGTIKLTLVVSPNDVNDALLDMKIGGIFMVAAVKIADDGSVEKPLLMEMGDRALKASAALCRNERFQKWMVENQMISAMTEEAAAQAIRRICGIKSRTELRLNQTAMMKFERIRSDFKEAIRRGLA